MKATDLLEQQHRKVKALFKKLERGRADSDALRRELADELAAHMTIEHELFYPAVIGLDEGMVNESFEEHALAEIALKRLLASDPADEAFKARVTALRELIEHHVEEEEQQLFPEVEKAIERERLRALGKEMKARFVEALQQGHEQLLPKGVSKTAADGASQKASRTRAKRAA